MNINKTFCSNPFLFQVIMQYILNLYRDAYQLCLDKTGGEKCKLYKGKDGETVETVSDSIFLGSKITTDGVQPWN